MYNLWELSLMREMNTLFGLCVCVRTRYVCLCLGQWNQTKWNKQKNCFFFLQQKNENIMCHVCIFETFYSICCFFLFLLCQVFLFFPIQWSVLFVRPEFVCDATAKTQKYTYIYLSAFITEISSERAHAPATKIIYVLNEFKRICIYVCNRFKSVAP